MEPPKTWAKGQHTQWLPRDGEDCRGIPQGPHGVAVSLLYFKGVGGLGIEAEGLGDVWGLGFQVEALSSFLGLHQRNKNTS